MSDDLSRQRRHASGGRPVARREGKRVHEVDAGLVNEGQRFFELGLGFGRKAGDEVGAERDLRALCPQRAGERDRIGAPVTALHALQDEVRPGLQRQMKIGRNARLARQCVEQGVVDLGAVDR